MTGETASASGDRVDRLIGTLKDIKLGNLERAVRQALSLPGPLRAPYGAPPPGRRARGASNDRIR